MDALIFDFDGVIVDTEPLHHQAFLDVLGEAGLAISWQAYCEDYIGLDDRDAFRLVHRRAGLPLDEAALNRLMEAKAAAFTQRTEQQPPSPYPGVLELVAAARDAGLPLGLCSGAVRSDILPILDRLGLNQAFKVLVSAEDVAVSKPDPASYRLCVDRLARTLGRPVLPGRTWAVEDTPAGLRSALDAGLLTVAVCTTHPPEQLGAASCLVESLDQVDLAMLESMTV